MLKKLIVLSVIFALVAGGAFAADVSGHVIGDVTLLGSDTSDATDGVISGSGGMGRIRLEASGGDDEGTFGGWLRIQDGFSGNVWWKPIDQFLLRIGGNGGDGYWGKDGVTRWMFYQTVSDTQVADNGHNAWGGADWSSNKTGTNFGDAFFGGWDGGLMMEIKPIDILGINIGLPYFGGGEVADIFKAAKIQLDVNLDFGNIAVTFDGANDGKVFAFVGIAAIENVDLHLGLGYAFAEGSPISVGLGTKIGISDSFNLKARVMASLAGDDEATRILFDVLPYFGINDSMTVFVSLGLQMVMPSEGDSLMGFHFNPYLQVGSEWGPKFLAGIKVVQECVPSDDAYIKWSIPIAINVGF